ncbi:MAG: hypothetical protein FJZ59_07495 [Chlamydiae bacterium]|nr:hypothetical protein [Chlamydiota bacterium]
MKKYLGAIFFLIGLAITFASSYEAIHFYGIASYTRSIGIILMATGLVVALFVINQKSNKS